MSEREPQLNNSLVDSSIDLDEVIGQAGSYTIAASSTYQGVSIPIVYTGSTNPVSCKLSIALTGSNGSYFIIDDIELSNTPLAPTGIESLNGFKLLDVYPNWIFHSN